VIDSDKIFQFEEKKSIIFYLAVNSQTSKTRLSFRFRFVCSCV